MQNLLNELQKIGFVFPDEIIGNDEKLYNIVLVDGWDKEKMSIYIDIEYNSSLYKRAKLVKIQP